MTLPYPTSFLPFLFFSDKTTLTPVTWSRSTVTNVKAADPLHFVIRRVYLHTYQARCSNVHFAQRVTGTWARSVESALSPKVFPHQELIRLIGVY